MYGTGVDSLLKGVILLVVIIVIWLILREILTWYWKQTEIVNLLKEIRDRLPERVAVDRALNAEVDQDTADRLAAKQMERQKLAL